MNNYEPQNDNVEAEGFSEKDHKALGVLASMWFILTLCFSPITAVFRTLGHDSHRIGYFLFSLFRNLGFSKIVLFYVVCCLLKYTAAITIVGNLCVLHGDTRGFENFSRYLTQEPRALKIRFLKYYPQKRDFPVDFFDVHFQSDAYLIKHSRVVQTNEFDWRAMTDHVLSVRWDDIYYYHDSGTIFYHDVSNNPNTRNRVVYKHDWYIRDLYSVLNLGLSGAPLWKVSFTDDAIYATNSFPSVDRPSAGVSRKSLSGNVLYGGNGAVIGLDLPLVYSSWPEKRSGSRKYHWLVDYHYNERFLSEPAMPSVINSRSVQTNGSTNQLHQIIVDHFEYCDRLDRSSFMPDNILNISNVVSFRVLVSGKWRHQQFPLKEKIQ